MRTMCAKLSDLGSPRNVTDHRLLLHSSRFTTPLLPSMVSTRLVLEVKVLKAITPGQTGRILRERVTQSAGAGLPKRRTPKVNTCRTVPLCFQRPPGFIIRRLSY